MGGVPENDVIFFVKKLSTENFVRKKMMKKKYPFFLSLCFLRKDDDVKGGGGGGRAKDDIGITCGGEVKKLTFLDDVISGQPLIGSIEPGWKGLTRKIVPIVCVYWG